MALIVIQHSVVDAFPVDPTFVVTSTTRVLAGCLVGLNSSAFLAKGSATVQPLGIAGDSISDEYKTTAYGADLVVSPTGAKRWTQNRIDNAFNEALASGLMTVYLGSGKFATDQYVTSDSWSTNLGQKVYTDPTGNFTLSSATNARPVGYVAAAPTDFPSGVPGVDAPSVLNSMSLGQYLTVIMSI